MAALPAVSIDFCTGCRWQGRACWIASELLSSQPIADQLESIVLRKSTPGVFKVSLTDKSGTTHVLSNREQERQFPELAALKRSIRDKLAPHLNLGHVEKKPVLSDLLQPKK